MGLQALLWFVLASSLNSVQPYKCHINSKNLDTCDVSVRCVGIIQVNLPSICTASPNHAIDVKLNYFNPIEDINEFIGDSEEEFLQAVTSFSVMGNWSISNNTFLVYMSQLKIFNANDNNIQNPDFAPFYTLSRIEEINLSHNRITNIENLFHFEIDPKNLIKINLSHNSISELDRSDLGQIFALEELDLSYNKIIQIDEDTLVDLSNLITLRLNNNHLTNLHGSFNNLTSLKHLYVSGNNIQHVDQTLFPAIRHLETFDISNNEIISLAPEVFERHLHHMEGVCKIDLSGNKISIVPNATQNSLSSRHRRHTVITSDYKPYTELNLSNNEITIVLYHAFQATNAIRILNLSHNKLKQFVVDPETLSDVINLNLSFNEIENLDVEIFKYMTNLNVIDLSFNKIFDLPENIFFSNKFLTLVDLKHNHLAGMTNKILLLQSEKCLLDLSQNNIKRLESIHYKGSSLITLILNDNNIVDAVNIDLHDQSSLKRVELCNNQIILLNKMSLNLPSSLIDLNLRNNSINKIGSSSFMKFIRLNMLSLASNNLSSSSIDYDAFRGLFNLVLLDLSYNKIKFIKDSKIFIDLKSLRTLLINGNKMFYFDYIPWLGHAHTLQIYMDGNEFSCKEVGKAIKDFENKYSPVKPTYTTISNKNDSIKGVSCIKSKYEEDIVEPILIDERLLIMVEKLLDAVRNQTKYLEKLQKK